MQSFKDNEGQTWNIALSIGKARQISEKVGLDICNQDHHMQVLGSFLDQMTFVFLIVEDQAKKRGVDVDGFELLLEGDDVSTNASVAFLEELENFFLRHGKRFAAHAKLTRASVEIMKKANARLADMVDTGKMDSLIDDARNQLETLILETDGNT